MKNINFLKFTSVFNKNTYNNTNLCYKNYSIILYRKFIRKK